MKNERTYHGTASNFLAEHLRAGRSASVFVQKSHGFRLPADPCAPVIMIGPGTGTRRSARFCRSATLRRAGKELVVFRQPAARD
jgi:sulfite reductase (NADPH) flavoprotein alpha-component